jgi:hypothetical protein
MNLQINNTVKVQMQILILGGDVSESIWREMMKMLTFALLDSLQTLGEKRTFHSKHTKCGQPLIYI